MKLLRLRAVPGHHAFAKATTSRCSSSFDELLAQSDFLTLHLPVTKESKHLINKQSLAKMKPSAYLINTARGLIVNEADLIDAAKAKKLAGAGLDVFEDEPPADSPLFHMDNVVVTPHAAGVDLQSRDEHAALVGSRRRSVSPGDGAIGRRRRWSIPR